MKPLEDYSLDKRHADGRQSRCKACFNDYKRQYREANADRLREMKRQEYQRNKATYHATSAAYRQANRESIAQQARARLDALSDAEREAFRARRREVSREYRLRNPEVCAERIRAWQQANPDKTRDRVHRRRAKQRDNGPVEDFTRDEIGERDGWVCGICHASIDSSLQWPDQMSASLDHVIPLARGGPHTRANSRISHWICNVRRGADRKFQPQAPPLQPARQRAT